MLGDVEMDKSMDDCQSRSFPFQRSEADRDALRDLIREDRNFWYKTLDCQKMRQAIDQLIDRALECQEGLTKGQFKSHSDFISSIVNVLQFEFTMGLFVTNKLCEQISWIKNNLKLQISEVELQHQKLLEFKKR